MDIIDRLINEFFPERQVPLIQKKLFKWALGEKLFSPFLNDINDRWGLEYVYAAAKKLNLQINVNCYDYDNIPAIGPVVIVSNHPSLVDGLALVSTVSVVRKDIKIIANHLLQIMFPAIEGNSIGIQNMHGKFAKKQFKEINEHLKNGGVLIICPSGRLAKATLTGIKESQWYTGFIQFAVRANASLVPVYISGRNSLLYYLVATVWRQLSNIMFMRELLRHKDKKIHLKIGKQIDLSSVYNDKKNIDWISDNIREHVLRIGEGKKTILPELPPVALPEDRVKLFKELNEGKKLRVLNDGKILFLYQYQKGGYSPVIAELGRLRELTYRSIGAGTRNRRDNDIYDNEYYHIILWDPDELEIVGAYRLMPAGVQIERKGIEGLYSNSIFNYQQEFIPKINECIEIGRGFIQNKYQRTGALDALWKGIFSFVINYPQCKYFLGVLSIPQSYPEYACKLIVHFFNVYFYDSDNVCVSPNYYSVNDEDITRVFSGGCFEDDWQVLNKKLCELGCELPWPYKQAAKWYQPGGSRIFCFAVDDHFNSIAGLNFCDISKLKNLISLII